MERRLNKTKVEEYPDLAVVRENYDKECKRQRQEAARDQKKRELLEQQERDKDKQERSYDRIMQVRVGARRALDAAAAAAAAPIRLHPTNTLHGERVLSLRLSRWARHGCTIAAS